MDRFVSLIDAGEDSQCIIKAHLANLRGFVVCRIHSSAEAAFQEITRHLPDVILIHVRLPGICGFECAHTLKKLQPRLPVVLFTEEAELAGFVRAFQAGADGYFVLPGSAESLQETIRNALDGWKSFSREIQSLLVQRLIGSSALATTGVSLTSTEQKVMTHLVLGLSDKETAKSTGNATATIHSITSHIYPKLGVHTRTEAVRVYLGFNPKSGPEEHLASVSRRVVSNQGRKVAGKVSREIGHTGFTPTGRRSRREQRPDNDDG